MPALEIAQLHQVGSEASTSADQKSSDIAPPVKDKLREALKVLTESATPAKHPFRLFQELEDPTNLYISGPWPSISGHEAFLPSTANQQLLSLLKDKTTVPWMFHIEELPHPDHAPADLAASKEHGAQISQLAEHITELFESAPVVGLGFHYVARDQHAAFEEAFRHGRSLLEQAAGYKSVAGWRVGRVYGEQGADDEPAEDCFVLLSGWESIQAHRGFGDSKEYKEYSGFVKFMTSGSVRHMRKVLL